MMCGFSRALLSSNVFVRMSKFLCSLASAIVLAGCTSSSPLLRDNAVRVVAAPVVEAKAIAVPAPKPQTSSLSVLVRRALSRHPDIARAKAVIAKTDAGVGAANAVWYPDITYGVSPGFQDKGYGSATIGVNQLVYDFGKSQAALGVAESERGKAQQQLLVAAEAVTMETALAYVALATAFAQRAEAERYVAELRGLRDRVASRVEAGASDLSDRVTADAALGRAEGEVDKAQASVLVAQSSLAELTGQAPQRAGTLDDIAKLLSRQGKNFDINHAPGIRAAVNAVRSAEYNVSRTRAETLPPIRIAGQYTANATDDGYSGQTWLGLKVENSFSTGGLASWKVDAAEAERDAAQQALEGEKLKAITAQKQAEIETTAAMGRVKRFLAIHALAQSSGDLAWERYQLDKQPLREVISSEREKFAARSDIITAHAEALRARLRGYAAVGNLTRVLIGMPR
jgi:outer membrane protein, adhesin transport system